jgi:GH25 family lysozyme M1 (1,4-beta-N-acetylmuramidase)
MRNAANRRRIYLERSSFLNRMGAFMAACTRLRNWTARISALTITAGTLVIAHSPSTGAAPLPAGSTDHYAGSEILKHEGASTTSDRTRALTASAQAAAGAVPGMDVSSHQGDINWPKPWADGARFAYVKATEGTGYKNPNFRQQYDGAVAVGMAHGGYHFALPDRSDGATQANFFVENGGGWMYNGVTLPPALDMEYNPYGDTCYGMNQAQMTDWVKSFSDQVRVRAGRYPAIYTSTTWWNRCVNADFSSTNPLWVARYASQVGELPTGWDFYTIWQFNHAGVFPGDQNTFNGVQDQLDRIVRG